ncbi:MAG: hypothetical protein AB7E77_08065 [Desulfobulbus sp.]
MTARQAIHILMLSPCYWLMSLPDRKQLIHEFRLAFATAWPPDSGPRHRESAE